MSQSLNDLRDEEECEIDGMLFQYAMRVLQNERVIMVPPFEERDSSDRRNQGPQ